MLPVWFLCLSWALSAANKCDFIQSPSNVSAVLDSLQCYNDYTSHFHCTWKEEPERHSNTRLQLMFLRRKENQRIKTGTECKDQEAAEGGREGARECRYETPVFSMVSLYTAYFKDPHDLCSTIKPTAQHLPVRARTPTNLSTSTNEHGDTLITWTSPYPPALNINITYQVFYRLHGHDGTTVEVSDTQMRLDKLIHGRGYEAMVRARVGQGHWSLWSPTVSWETQIDPKQVPHVDCVWGEEEAHCSWEQSKKLSHFIIYQLCHYSHAPKPQTCCEHPEVSLGHKEDTVKFRCRLPLPKSPTSTLRMELVPKVNSITFRAMDHIRPNPPTKVNVTQKGTNLVVEWTPEIIQDFPLSHEVRYYSQLNEEDAKIVPNASTPQTIPMGNLPSRRYWVQVHSLVVDSYYGSPSDWSPPVPVDWTPEEDSEKVSYISWKNYTSAAAVIVVIPAIFIIVFIFLVFRRRVFLWVDSIPSPYKSKVVLNIQSVKHREMTSCEETYLSKIVDIDSVSTCSSIVSPWLKKGLHMQTGVAEDEGIWSDDNLPASPLTPMSFTGPYILFQPVDQTEGCGPAEGGPAQDYVRLPSVSASTQDLSSLNHDQNQEQPHWNTEVDPGEEEQRRHTNHYVCETFWPQEGDKEASGYCQLPADITQPRAD